MRRSLVISLVIATIAAFTIYGFVQRGAKPEFGERSPVTIDLVIGGERIGTATNAVVMMTLLREGQPVRSHECTLRGMLILHYGSGENAEMAILPGHTESRYEFVFGGQYYAVPRSAFISALTSAGVDELKIPTK